MDPNIRLRSYVAFGMAAVALLLSYFVFRYTVSPSRAPGGEAVYVDSLPAQ